MGDALFKYDENGNLNVLGDNEALKRVFAGPEKLEQVCGALADAEAFARACPEIAVCVHELSSCGGIEYVADFSREAMRLIEEGKLTLRVGKDGSLLAQLVRPGENAVREVVRLKEVRNVAGVTNLMFGLSLMAIAQQLNQVQDGIDQIRAGQIHDRESIGRVAADHLVRASKSDDAQKAREEYGKAHDLAIQGFFGCLSTVEEASDFFMRQSDGTQDWSIAKAAVYQLRPDNLARVLRNLSKYDSMRDELRRAVARCTYCVQYAAIASYLLEDYEQVMADLEMYDEHMSRLLLGERKRRLEGWLGDKPSRRALPGSVGLIEAVHDTVDRIRCVDVRELLPECAQLPVGARCA